MSSSVDRRILRTRKKLRLGLATLLQHKALAEITIRELSEISGVNRGTFYLHFNGISDMVESFHEESKVKFCEICDRYSLEALCNNPEPFLTELIQYLYENDDVCMVIFCRNDNYRFLSTLQDYLLQYFIDRSSESALFERKYSQYAATFVLSSISGVLVRWYQNGKAESPEIMAHLITLLLHPEKAVASDF